MSYSCLEELQVDLDLHALDKTNILSKVGCKCKCNKGWLVITDDGHCHLFGKDGNLDDIRKVTQLKEEYIRKDITKIIIPDSTAIIWPYTFADCIRLISVMIPDSVTSIGDGAFLDCSRLTNIMIGNGVASIGNNAFYYCPNITSMMIPDSATEIGWYVFKDCANLMSVTIGSGMRNIGIHAFYNCDKLINLTFKGKTLEQVKKMEYYPWGIEDESIIQVE